MAKIFIMGASSGIGLYVAEQLAKRGVTLALAARKTDKLRALQEKYPGKIHYASIDVTQANASQKIRQLIDKIDGIDIYFHAAGIGYENPDFNPEREVEVVNTNTTGFTRSVATAYAYFLHNKKPGRIAAISSVAGTNGMSRMTAYSASKKFEQTYLTALRQLSFNVKADIKITDIRPGWVSTPLISAEKKYPLQMPLDYAGNLIIKAIVKAPAVAYIDWRWGAVCTLWKLLPDCVWTRINLPISKPDTQLPR